MSIKKRASLNVYFCGGTGINTAMNLSIPNEATSMPETTFTLVDTSASNLPKNSNHDTYLIDGVDGTGKRRNFCFEVAESHISKILLAHKPRDTNIVVFGASGGSGSVLAPLLIKELIQRDQRVICFCVISTASKKETQNAYDTIANLQRMATTTLKKPIVCSFYTNCSETPRTTVDQLINEDIRAMAMLCSGLNDELDKEDITSWLNFHTSTAVESQLADLEVYLTNPDGHVNNLIPEAISVASLLINKDDEVLDINALYSCVGYCPASAQESTTAKVPSLHFVITNQLLEGRVSALRSILQQFKTSEEKLTATPIVTFDSIDSDLPF